MAYSFGRPAGLLCLALAFLPSSAWAQTVAVIIGSNYESGRQFSVSGTGCSPGPAYTTPQTLQWTPGASCTVEFVSPHGLTIGTRYTFSTWHDGVASNPRVFTAPAQAGSYNAIFNPEYRLTVQISPVGAGTVSAPEWVFSGTEPSLAATPAAGYRFVRWSGVDEQLGNTAKVRMSGYPRTVTAHFAAASSAMSTGYTVVPVISYSYNTPLLNEYGQVARQDYSSAELWTPQVANTISGTLARLPLSYARAINGRGQLVASTSPSTSLWSPAAPNTAAGTVATVTLPAAGFALNDYGQIGGEGYLWTPAVAAGSIGSTVQNSRFSGLVDINSQGQAVMITSAYVSGKYTKTVTLFTPSVPRTGTGTFTDLPAPASGSFQSVVAIGNTGAITGAVCTNTTTCDQRVFVWRPSAANGTTGTLEVVNPPAGFTTMSPTAMNDKGDVVGTMSLAGGDYSYNSVPFLYTGGVVYDLTTGEAAFGDASRLTINTAGQIAFSAGSGVQLATPAALNPAPASNAVPVTPQSSESGRVFSVSGADCQPGTYGAPRTLLWNPGASCTVTFASPHGLYSDIRHVFLSWQDGVTGNPRVIATPAQAKTFTATFNTQYLLSAEIIPAGAGTVSGTGWVTQNGTATLKATPAAGYRFVEWIYSYNSGTSDTLQVSTYSPHTVKAVFTSTATIPSRQYAVIPVAASSSSPAINDYGQITGSAAFLWTPSSANGIAGTLSAFSAVSGVSGAASLHINGRGQIAAIRPDNRPFLWSPSTPNTAAGTTVTLVETGLAAPTSMNDYGQVAGEGWVWTPSTVNGSTGTLVQTNNWPGVAGINNAGQMLVSTSSGWRLFTPTSRGASAGTYAMIGGPPGSPRMAAVNSSGHVAGDVCVIGTDPFNCPRRAFVSNPVAGTSSFTEIAPPPGIETMTAKGMNDHGEVVGVMRPSAGSLIPFLYSNGAVYDLSTVNAVLRGGTAEGINNAGQIVVTASNMVYLVSPIGPVTPPPPPPPPPATLTLSHSEVRFGATAGAAATGQQQVQVTLTGTNAASTPWSATSNQNWVTVTSASGTGSGKFLLTLGGVPTALPGALEATISVTTGTTTKTVRVILTITAASATNPPFGFLDQPANNAAVAGAVGVTGWALDDVEVTRIEVWRKAVLAEPHLNGQVFIGHGIFLDGARPDVANANPTMPYNTRAGWGMQILTNMLPNTAGTGPRGNGQHQLFVYAFDKEGRSTLLGSRAINVNNAGAVRPFGTIATPTSGGDASGAMYTVFGWALTPQPAIIPFDGSTLWVFVDGVSLGHPVYNQYRPDIAALFPGLRNSNGAVGFFYLDTTRLTNGMHSIAWSVTDNLNRVEGIGSRLFFVQNAGASPASEPSRKSASIRTAEREGIWLRTGYDPNAPLQKLEGNTIEVAQGGRIELHVAGAESVEFDGNAALPVGSTFEGGAFYWQLDVTYIASYELKFRDANGAALSRVAVRVKN